MTVPKQAWSAHVVTLFPEAFPGVLQLSLTGKALAAGLWQLTTHDLRTHGAGRHRNVDDTPAGGGAGMVLRADVVARAMRNARSIATCDLPMLYLSPRGHPFGQTVARELATGPGVILLCGRFEGVDERVLEALDIVEVSLGDFVLSGGEIAAQAMIDACVRLLPGVLGNPDSPAAESFANHLLEHPHYTRPALWEGRAIPEVLMSGHHGQITAWRQTMSEDLTRTRRPDLWARYKARKDRV